MYWSYESHWACQKYIVVVFLLSKFDNIHVAMTDWLVSGNYSVSKLALHNLYYSNDVNFLIPFIVLHNLLGHSVVRIGCDGEKMNNT